MKHELRAVLALGAGSIVNTSSIAGLIGVRNSAAYTASKHGVVGLNKAATPEVAGRGVACQRGLPRHHPDADARPRLRRPARAPDRIRRCGADGPDRSATRGRRRRRLPLLGRRVLPHGRGDPGEWRLDRRLVSGAGRGGVRTARGDVDHGLTSMTAVLNLRYTCVLQRCATILNLRRHPGVRCVSASNARITPAFP